MNGLRAFSGLASNYQKFRPDYPLAVLERLKSFVQSSVTADSGDLVLVDVGSGTGISTRRLRVVFGPAPKVLGIEPSNDMLRAALSSTPPGFSVAYVQARAERLPFGDATVTLILAAQSVQWFQRPAFYAEARRVLVPGGTLAILENNRRWQASPFLDAYERFLETHSVSYSRHYREHDYPAELWSSGRFAVLPPDFVDWSRPMDVETFLIPTANQFFLVMETALWGRGGCCPSLILGVRLINERTEQPRSLLWGRERRRPSFKRLGPAAVPHP